MNPEDEQSGGAAVVNPEQIGGAPDASGSPAELARRMFKLIYGNWQTCVTYAFAELGLADRLRGGPRTVGELAADTATDEPALGRFLRCAATLGLVATAGAPGRYALTPFGGLLRSDHPFSQRAAAQLNGAPYRYQPWGRLLEVLRTGDGRDVSPSYANGTLAYLADRPDDLTVFHRAMTDLSAGQNQAVARSFDFAPFAHVVDVGGGEGTFVRAVLAAHPHLRGTLFDLPEALISGQSAGGDDDLGGRLERLPGDFFAEVPAGGDVYVLKNVVHNWPEEKALRLLGNVRAAMTSGGAGEKRLLIVEHVIAEDDDFGVAKWLDLNFMVLVGGAERTLDEYRALGRSAGFELLRALPTPTGRYILELAAV